jgi:hypothetical protein
MTFGRQHANSAGTCTVQWKILRSPPLRAAHDHDLNTFEARSARLSRAPGER